MNPITPGRYRTRGGEVVEVSCIEPDGEYPVIGKWCGESESWTTKGTWWTEKPSHRDLVSRLDDAPNPLIAPLEWALGQLEESLDPDWQAAYKAATEALKLAKQK